MPEPPEPPKPPMLPAIAASGEERAPAETLVAYLCRRIEDLQRELESSQRRAIEAQGSLRHQQGLRNEVEEQLKTMREHLRREKTAQEQEAEKLHARGRVDVLEKRLDEMHQTFAQLLKEAIASRENADSGGLDDVRGQLEALRERLNALPRLSIELQELRSALPEDQGRRIGAILTEHLDVVQRRIALDLEKQQDRFSALAREQAALEATLRDAQRQWQQQALEERAKLQTRLDEQAEEIKKALAALQASRDEEGEKIRQLHSIADRFVETLNRPRDVKDEMASALQREKEDLLKALRERNREFQAYNDERRELERSMSEQLLQLARQLEEEKASHRRTTGSLDELKAQAEAAESRAALARKEVEEKDRLYAALSAERDELAKALMAEAEKTRSQLVARTESEHGWDERARRAMTELDAERQKRLEQEMLVADLQGKLKTLSEHLARALQEKEAAGGASASWRQEKEELLAALRKKDEMISMLSSTFQNFLQKPEPPKL